MNPAIIGQFGHADPRANPLTINELIDLLNQLGHYEIAGSYIPYVISATAPGVDDRDKAWLQLDSHRRPIATKTWVSGSWRRVYNGMLNEIKMYTGNPNTDFTSVGMGKIGELYDGWHLCNGSDGTVDLSDRFIIGAHMNNVGHAGWTVGDGWVTWISNTVGEHDGGVRDITLDAENTFRPDRPKVTVDKWVADGNARDSSGQLWGKGNQPPSGDNDVTLLAAEEGNLNPPSISTIPPFIALGFIQFLGYIDIT